MFISLKTSIRHIITIPGLLLIIGCTPGNTESDKVWYSMEDAQEKIANSEKKILVDVYKDNCNESKQFHEFVYPDEKVEKTLSKYFCSVRINASSEDSLTFNGELTTHKELAETLGVTSYPTIVFLDNEGEKIIITSGYMEADIFAKILSYVGSDAYLNTEFDLYVN